MSEVDGSFQTYPEDPDKKEPKINEKVTKDLTYKLTVLDTVDLWIEL